MSVYVTGSEALQAGLSANYNVTVSNDGDVGAPAEVFIVFAGKLEQTGQLRFGGGAECEVRPPNTVRCTTPQLAPKTQFDVVVQGRGSSPGIGQLVATVNPSRSVPEGGFGNPSGAFSDNTFQKNVTIS